MFITFEGADGSGKTTALNKLKAYLDSNNIDYVLTREPGFTESWTAKQIREIIVQKNSDVSDMTEAILFAADRRLHLEKVIWPALNKNRLVLCDRYFDSSFAYQGNARNLGMERIIKLNENITDNTYPDMTIYFDLPLEESLKRVDNRGEKNRLDAESVEFHKKVHEGYAKLIEMYPDRYRVVDATKTPDEVFEQLKKILENQVLDK